MRVLGGIEKGRDGGVGRAYELGRRDAFCGLLAPLSKEVKKEAVKRTGWCAVTDGCHAGGILRDVGTVVGDVCIADAGFAMTT